MRQLATFCQPPEGESNAPSPQPAVQTNTRANQIAKRALQIAKNTARSHTSLHSSGRLLALKKGNEVYGIRKRNERHGNRHYW
ncbi:hypothetical protein, partial [Mycobacterium avium]|uniref:hypothetical protein n=1 Tax=Mycobacterium avium TaxID=1764 RepID=UPI001E5A3BF2